MRKKRSKSRRLQQWLWPTAGLFHHVAIAAAGVLALALGLFMSFQELLRPAFETIGEDWDRFAANLVQGADSRQITHLAGGLLLLAGTYAVYAGVKGFFRRLGNATGSSRDTLVAGYLKRRQLARGPRIVALGGGTGMSTLLRGLKQYSSNITAIVTVTDDGGSSGRISQEMGIIPPGDMRNCLVALADAEKRMTDLFQHRFGAESGALAGHSLGNLFLAGLVTQAGGDFDKALSVASEVLNIRGRVVPTTTTRTRLRAIMEDGSELCGETLIVASDLRIQRVLIDPEDAQPHPTALEAIREADLIVLGPGSVYTSVVASLLVPGIAQALAQSEAVKAYVCNVMTQKGESDAFTAAEHVVAVQANVPARVFDFVLVNTGTPSPTLLARYEKMNQQFVVPDIERLKQMGYRPVSGNFMSETDFVRHDPLRVAAQLIELLAR